MAHQSNTTDVGTLVDRLKATLGDQHVLTDRENLELHSFDFSEEPGSTAVAVVRPGSTEEVAKASELCSSNGFALVPRGGGMSYTLGYTPQRENTVIIDLGRMNRIVEINTEDLYITVESGVTWKQIHEALLDMRYRIPFIGTFSGAIATVGGGIGNNCVGLGQGEVNECLLGIEVVLSDGRIIQTGGRATGDPTPSLRHAGPDITGLFVHDNGAFGIKTKATFRLARKPGGTAFACFGFQDRTSIITAMCECGRLGVASELFGSAIYHHRQFAGEPPPSKEERKEMVQKIIRSSSSRLRGVRDLLRSARPGGVKFLEAYEYSLLVIVDGFDQQTADRGLAAIKGVAKKYGGKTLPPILPLVMRADPFMPVDRLIQGIEGACSIPSSCVVPLSRAHELVAGVEQFWEENAPLMQEQGVEKTCNFIIVKGMFGIEPILYWKDKLNPLRLSILSPERRKLLEKIPANLEARKTAVEVRRKMHTLFREFEGVHFGIGKYYPYRESLQSEDIWNVLEGMKTVLDPGRLMNPGALGLK
jgi:FAD/FMN-containing dehydrogenase